MAQLALRLGCVGFGGGYALIAQARHAVVERDRWLTEREFLDQVAVAASVPGGTAANLMTLLGLRAGGVGSAAVSLFLFILPSSLLLAVCGAFYASARDLGPVQALLSGLGPAVVAICLAVGLQLSRGLTEPWQFALAVAAFICVAFRWLGVLPVIALSAPLALLARRAPGWLRLASAGGGLRAVPPWQIAWVFVQISLSMFGGGLAMIAAIQQQLVERLAWLSPAEFRDAIALSQVTPGPIATAGSFIGFRLAGWPGALAANLGVFAPAFALTLIAARLLARHGAHPDLKAVLSALSAATVGMVFAAAVSLARSGSLVGPLPLAAIDWALVVVGFGLLVWKRTNPLWILAGSAGVHVALLPLGWA